MEKNYKIHLNPKPLTSEQVKRHQDFDALLKKYKGAQPQPVRQPILRKLIYISGAIAASVAILFFIFQGVGNEDYGKQERTHFASQPYVNPPLKNVKPSFASYQVNANEGGVYEYPSGSKLVVPAAAFADENGNPLEGDVTIYYREMHDFVDFFLSGIPMTYDSAGVEYNLESAGMVEIFAEQDGKRVAMAQGKSIDVELVSRVNVSPELTVPKGYNIYRLNEEDRRWEYREIDRMEVLDEDLAFENLDVNDPLFNEKKELQERIEAIQLNRATKLAKIEASVPKPKQPIKPQAANGENHVFDLDLSDLIGESDGTAAQDELTELYRKYESMLWQISPNSSVTPQQLQDFGAATGMSIHKLNGRDYELTLLKGDENLKVTVNPVLTGSDYDAALAEYERDYERFQSLMAQREERLRAEKEALEQQLAEEKRLAQLKFEERIAELRANGLDYAATKEIIAKKVVNRFQATGFGIWNCDRPLPPDMVILAANFKDESGKAFQNRTAYLVDKNRNTVYQFLAEDGAPLRFNANSNNLLWLITDDNKLAVFRPEDFKAIKKDVEEHTFVMSKVNKQIESEEDVRDILYL